jgi:hypothetical protein
VSENDKPITDESQAAWEALLTEQDRAEILRQAHLTRAINKAAAQEEKIDWATLDDASFAREKRKLGIG